MSYRQGYTELEGQFTTVVGGTTSGNTAAFGANEIGIAEIGIGACSGAAIGSTSVALQHHANASVSGLHMVAQGIGAARILNNALTATQLAVGVASGAVIGSLSVGLEHYNNTSVTNAILANNSCSGLRVSPEYGPAGTGSPLAFGNIVKGFTGATGGGSDAWIVYPTAFAA